MLEVAEADLELAQACRKSLAERVDANDRAFRGFPMAAWVASHAPECTVEGDRGFESGSLHRRVGCEPDSEPFRHNTAFRAIEKA
jgi:hypothetical protein